MNLDELKLVEFNSLISEDEVEEDLIESRIVGLMAINNDGKLLVVCLASKKTIYLFDPKNENSRAFIINQLQNNKIRKICTVNGEKNALLLDQAMGIKIYVKKEMNIESLNNRMLDLETFEQQCEIRQTMLDKIKYHYKKEPYTLQLICKKFVQKNLDYHQLVLKYLDLNIDVKFTEDELEAIESQLMSKPEAIRRCVGPLRSLAEKMYRIMKNRKHRDSRDLMGLIRCDDRDIWELYLQTQDRSLRKLHTFIESFPTNTNHRE